MAINAARPTFDFEAALSRLPGQPGVYRMYGARGSEGGPEKLLYVGKAKSLKNRVRSYFQNPAGLAPKVQALMAQVTRFDYIVTDSEVEALILEYNLIKQNRPKYNILLRDDKKFPWIGLSAEPYPRLFVTRDPSGRGKYFGPYAYSGSMNRTLQVIRKHFPLRQRRKPLFKNRPCMNYFIGTCSGPCQKLVTEAEYAETVKQVSLFLKGKADELLARLEGEMQRASEALNFELAAKLRDRYLAVQDVVEQQKMYYSDASVNQDIIASVSDARRCAIVVLQIRGGKLIGSRPHEILLSHQASPEEAYNDFLSQYYQDEEPEDIPDELILQYPVEDEGVLQELLNARRSKRGKRAAAVTLVHPQKGIKKDMLDLAVKNATETLAQAQTLETKSHRNDPARALLSLQEALNLPEFPIRMECYDISHFQGAQTVASMVVFTNGMPDKKEYRRFKINTAEGEPNDFQSMFEVITRRFKRALGSDGGNGPTGDGASNAEPMELGPEEEVNPALAKEVGNDAARWEVPDLVIIDGGKGQLSSAVDALRQLGLEDQPIISLAKKFEEVYLPGESRPVLLPRDSAALFLLQQIRDEAHRFAITYHRSLRDKAAKGSILDDVPGVGEKRKQKLLKHFGSIGKLRQASLDEIAAVPGLGRPAAEAVFQALHTSD